MAKDEELLDTEQAEVKSETDNKTEAAMPKYHRGPMGWLIALVVIFFVLVVAGMVGGMAMFRHERLRNPVITGIVSGERIGMGMRGGFRMHGSGIISSNQVQISGVVTAVNGSNFTVAGNGTTNSVTTSSSTTFTGATKVNVNDSVIVVGTTNNGTFTATQVVVSNVNN